MALIVADRVAETSTTTGTGALALAAAITGFQRFSAVCTTSDTIYYVIVAVDANGNPSGDWECGLGTYSSANTLTRTTPQASTNANAAVNFAAGTKHVYAGATAAYLATAYRAGGTDVALADGGTGASLVDPNADRIMFWDDSAGAVAFLAPATGLTITTTNLTVDSTAVKPTENIIIACSDESTAITTGTAKVTFRMPYAFTVTDVRASVNTAPTGSTILIDINEAGTTILSTKLMIDASEKTSTTAATPAVISDSSLADDAEMTIDFDQVGSTIAGKGVKVILIGTRT